jgi:hypothetical protein
MNRRFLAALAFTAVVAALDGFSAVQIAETLSHRPAQVQTAVATWT